MRVSEQTDDIAAEATTLTDFGLRFDEVPGLTEAGPAGQARDDFVVDTCGFSTGDN